LQRDQVVPRHDDTGHIVAIPDNFSWRTVEVDKALALHAVYHFVHHAQAGELATIEIGKYAVVCQIDEGIVHLRQQLMCAGFGVSESRSSQRAAQQKQTNAYGSFAH